ncbi:MAG: hypothetical protein NDJ89_17675 [Oligoflexia bacterium]|nr:hypothetical protein [Oligoflexia bacterium]
MKRKNGALVVLISITSTVLNPALADSVSGTIRPGPRPQPTATASPSPTPTAAPAPIRPGPRPTPTATATPAPIPTTEPTVIPTADPGTEPVTVDTSTATQEGEADGREDGAQEGRERGAQDGLLEGEREGRRDGFERCAQEERQRNYDTGYAEGYRSGQYDGQREGSERGEADGGAQGQIDGHHDGLARADRDADRDASPVGRARGIEEADRSDATDRGTRDGAVAGDRQARERAIEIDYARAREELRNERFAEPIRFQDEFSQRSSKAAPKATSLLKSLFQLSSRGDFTNITPERDGGSADFRYFNPSRNYSTPEENGAYLQAYRSGYLNGFRIEYASTFRFTYREGHEEGAKRGCQDARRRDYREHFNRGFEVGRLDGYRQAYDRAYEEARRSEYNRAFPRASELAYRDAYQPAYDRHFEESRAQGYRERVSELYGAAFERSRQATFEARYPGYAVQETERGRKDEARDFVERPVRLLAAEVLETIDNGLMEPGEALRLRLTLRNFANQAINGKDLRIKIEALDLGSAVITEGEAVLVRNLREQSSTAVTNALEFRMNESAVRRASRFRVTAQYQGRGIGELSLEVNTRFQVEVALAGELTVKDGLPTTLKIRLTNQSLRATDAALKLRLATDSGQLEVPHPEQLTGGMEPGESREIEFTVIGRTAQDSIRIPLAVSVNGAGRRVGLLDATDEVPVVNDYRVTLTGAAGRLTEAGVARMTYRVRNLGSRLLYKGLQLRITVKNTANTENFAVIGPATQYLMPLEKGEQATFLVPVLVKAANESCTLELELQEDGHTVAIHQVNFQKTLNLSERI